MTLSPENARSLLGYTAWASGLLVDAAGQLAPEELTRDFGTATKSVLGTLVHIFGADRVWLARVQSAAQQPFLTEADYQMAVLQNDWPVLHQRWKQWAADLTDESLAAEVAYKDLKGDPYCQPLWQLIQHVVNHGTHHRGQVAGFLRVMGHAPPPLDLVRYYRLGEP
jgi:uncharacterized damage-inducible protein DinB